MGTNLKDRIQFMFNIVISATDYQCFPSSGKAWAEWINNATRIVLNRIPVSLLWLTSETVIGSTSSSIDILGEDANVDDLPVKILAVERRNNAGTNWRRCREISQLWKYKAAESGSIYEADDSDPVFFFQGSVYGDSNDEVAHIKIHPTAVNNGYIRAFICRPDYVADTELGTKYGIKGIPVELEPAILWIAGAYWCHHRIHGARSSINSMSSPEMDDTDIKSLSLPAFAFSCSSASVFPTFKFASSAPTSVPSFSFASGSPSSVPTFGFTSGKPDSVPSFAFAGASGPSTYPKIGSVTSDLPVFASNNWYGTGVEDGMLPSKDDLYDTDGDAFVTGYLDIIKNEISSDDPELSSLVIPYAQARLSQVGSRIQAVMARWEGEVNKYLAEFRSMIDKLSAEGQVFFQAYNAPATKLNSEIQAYFQAYNAPATKLDSEIQAFSQAYNAPATKLNAEIQAFFQTYNAPATKLLAEVQAYFQAYNAPATKLSAETQAYLAAYRGAVDELLAKVQDFQTDISWRMNEIAAAEKAAAEYLANAEKIIQDFVNTQMLDNAMR